MNVRKISPVSGSTSVDQALQQQAIAQALQQRASQPNVPANGGPVQAQYGAGNALVDLANSLAASWNLKQANNRVTAAQNADSETKANALTKYMNSTPDDQVAQESLYEPVTPRSTATANMGKAFGPQMQSQLAAALLSRDMSQKPAEPYTLAPDAKRYDASNKEIAANPKPATPPKRSVEWKDTGDKLLPVWNDTGETVAGLKPIPKNASPAQQANRFEQGDSDLLAALAQRGVSLPQGLRSKEQMAATLRGLRERNTGLSSDEIADKIANGQIGFGAEKKSTQTAAGIEGKTAVGENELIAFAPKALAASQKVSRGNFVPFSRLVQLGEKNVSDPDLKEFMGRTQAILNAYDVVAARGGTDKEKRAHNREMLETADSAEAYQRGLETLVDEANIAQGAAHQATLPKALQAKALPPTNAKGWVLHVDAKGNKAYVSPDGKQYEVAQ